MTTTTPALWLDIDGTVREGYSELGRFVNGPDDVRVFPAAVERMRAWKEAGGRIFGVSNQGGIALGLVTLQNVLDAFHETQQQAEGLFDHISFCLHHPDATDPDLALCWCRKPRAGLIIQTAFEVGRTHDEYYRPDLALMVGDRPEDEACAAAANVPFQWAADWRTG